MTIEFSSSVALPVARPEPSPEALAAPESGIVEVFAYGRGRQGLIPLFVGEGDLPTPPFIVEAASRSLTEGETFYTYQAGVPELRAAIAAYMSRHYGAIYERTVAPFSPEQFFVTIGGMHALQIALRLVARADEEVIVPTPAWPNFHGALSVLGARPITVPMLFQNNGSPGWTLDFDRIEASITPATRCLIVNTPSNPTGWVASLKDLETLLALTRRHGLWLVADEIYGRMTFNGERAPSFHDIMEKDDNILFLQTFSKNWAMTGLRLGWLEAPRSLAPIIENLIQYSTSGVAVPWQRAATVALEQGEDFFQQSLRRIHQGRTILYEGLKKTGRIIAAEPEGAFYLFCKVMGETDTRQLALRLIDEANVGVAPGTAFGPGGEEFLRLCFARDPALLTEAVRRLSLWLEQHG
ncbi:pyridoxal phosphate-dependent aminotransferase [Beijerinckia indica]|uniref:aspartate transaminase n=1 Tax=Beijerinckia indica subsp. indica (strain ATCC 9039 / DSM 1715 / NCIMB 8712) TaxID=395963 RepID=B2ID04_BEII9|nr:pyridoxal phosphate-dependent aminotransferase [Beijerinckia indica]ACB96769.1 aminotransferase class I and II [Beijerinckia indica subsp. indica ATCC 9039]